MSMYMPDILAILYEFFFIGGKLFYNTVMVSAVLQRISVITIYISLPLEPSSHPQCIIVMIAVVFISRIPFPFDKF